MMKRFLTILLMIGLFATGCAQPAVQEEQPKGPDAYLEAASATPETAPAAAPTAPLTPAPRPTPVTFPASGFCNGEGVNLRAEPGTDAPVVDIMGENAVVNVLGLSGDWYRVNAGGIMAYVSRDLITLGEPPRADNMRWGSVIPETLPLYITPDENDLSDVTLAQGDVVRILRALDGYLHVVYRQDDAVGQRFCREDAIAPMPAVEAAPLWFHGEEEGNAGEGEEMNA